MTSATRSAPTHQLAIQRLFDSLSHREKLYAHHLSRAAWHGSRIILRQTSPESTEIFDFIIGLYDACEGKWNDIVDRCGVTPNELENFLEYAALFLCNLGNFYVSTAYCSTSYPLTHGK